MLPIQHLSTAVLFSEVTQIQWAESEQWSIVYPDVEDFSLQELQKIFPKMRTDDPKELRDKLASLMEGQQYNLEPRENYCIKLLYLKQEMGIAQAVLYKAHNPCRIVDLDGCPVITCPGDIWSMQDVLFRAFLLLGYVPPFLLHDDFGLESGFTNSKDKCQYFVQKSIDALLYEYRALSEAMC